MNDKILTLKKRSINLQKRATKAELDFIEKLLDLNIKFEFQKPLTGNGFSCILDFFIGSPYFVAIEIDGGYHEDEKQKEKDYCRDKYVLSSARIQQIRMTNDVAIEIPAGKFKELLKNLKLSKKRKNKIKNKIEFGSRSSIGLKYLKNMKIIKKAQEFYIVESDQFNGENKWKRNNNETKTIYLKSNKKNIFTE